MTFIETFGATSLTLFCVWIFKKYIEPILDKSHEKLIKKQKRKKK